MSEERETLVFKKWDAGDPQYQLPLKITVDLHTKVKEISRQTNLPINKVACMLVEFALRHSKVDV